MKNQPLVDLQTIVVPVTDILSTAIDDEVVMANLATEKYYGLDPVSTRIWQLLTQERRLTEVCTQLCHEFDVEPARCEQDVLEFVQTLVDAQLAQPMAA